MRFSLSLNSEHGPVADTLGLAIKAEEKGFDCVWYSQDLFKRDAWIFLTAISSLTKKIGLGTGIVNPYTVNPAELGMHAATLDEYSNGRLRLGISVGAIGFLKWIGIDVKHPISAIRESVNLIRRLFLGERVEHNGVVFKNWTKDAYMRFNLLRKRIPIYIGAQRRQMLELVGEIGDGGLPLLYPPEYVDEVLKHIAIGAARAGRSLEEIDIIGCVSFSVAKSRESAKESLRNLLTYYGPHLAPEMIQSVGLSPKDFEPIKQALSKRNYEKARSLMTDEIANIAIYGTPDECIDRIESLFKKGLKHIKLGPPLGPNPRDAIEIIGSEIIPYFSH